MSRTSAASLRPRKPSRYVLRLYVSGMTQRSMEAAANIRAICARYLHGRAQLEIVDIYENASRAVQDQIIAVPTLLRLAPAPVHRLVGNLADTAKVLAGLGLPQVHGEMDDSEVPPPAQV